MTIHSVAEAKNTLSDLINRALKGEDVVITRHGQPVVQLKPVPREPRHAAPEPRWTPEEQRAWLRVRRALLPPGKIDAGTFVSQMRDEERER
jgi:prevent-host-death family protein